MGESRPKARGLDAVMARWAQNAGLEMVRVFLLFFTGELSGQPHVRQAVVSRIQAVPVQLLPICNRRTPLKHKHFGT